ncbi:testin isoform X2 [Nothobranchius furzeri]|nr:testin isoform X2 [Nothobranchius furzeri]
MCRNCKCGLAEHDVSMESEENQKVGKLFEDTKYTGLIAKLKADGIPGYQGNMMTITLPSPATAYIIPPSASATAVPPSSTSSFAYPAGASVGSGHPAGASVGSGHPAGASVGSGHPAGASVGSGHPAGASVGSGHPAGASVGSGHPAGASVGSGHPAGASVGSGHPAGASVGSGHPAGASVGSGHPAGASVGSGKPAGTSAGSIGSAPQGHAQAHPAPLTPSKADKFPSIPISATAASVVSVPKDVPVKSITYEWAPPVPNKYLAVRYIELLPPEKRPVAGSEGAVYRRKQMARQLPEHDQDPSKCHELSPAEVKQMEQYVRKYKDEALGVGDVLLPEDMAQVQAGRQAGSGAGGAGNATGGGAPGAASGQGMASLGAGVRGGAGNEPAGLGAGAGTFSGPAGGAVGTAAAAGAMSAGLPLKNFSCHHCKKPMQLGEPAVYAERAGYDKLWHPACFVCCTCKELLVDMIYFWKKDSMYCGRHYGDSEKPRCAGCDELIFSNEYTQAEGQNWHLKHFCCFDCDCILAGETYVMEKDKPVCQPCYMNSYAVKCSSCQKPVEPEAQRVSYGEHHWHAEPDCFKCSGCTKCLMGQRFMAVKNFLFCSVECKKKIIN